MIYRLDLSADSDRESLKKSIPPANHQASEEEEAKRSFSIELHKGEKYSPMTVFQGACSLILQISRKQDITWRLFLLLEGSSVVRDLILENAGSPADSLTCPSVRPEPEIKSHSVSVFRKLKQAGSKVLICQAMRRENGGASQHYLSGFQVDTEKFREKFVLSEENSNKFCLEASERYESWRKMVDLMTDTATNYRFTKPFRFSIFLLHGFTMKESKSGTATSKMVLGGECGIVAPSSGDTKLDISFISGVCSKLDDLNGKYIADMRQDEEALEMKQINNRIAPIYRIQCPGNIRYFFISELENVEANIGPTQRALICRRAQAAVTL
jgi:hypothetical protein